MIRKSVGKGHYVDKGNHRHFMQKEIYEQPEVLSHTLGAFVDMTTGRDPDSRRPGPRFQRR